MARQIDALGVHHRPGARCGHGILAAVRVRRGHREAKLLAPYQPEVREEQLLGHAERREVAAPRNPVGFRCVETRALLVIVPAVGVALPNE